MLNSNELKSISQFCVNETSYSYRDVTDTPSNFLTLQIHDNTCRVLKYEKIPDGRMEQRQFSLLKLIESVLKEYRVPNSIFTWCHHDRTNLPHQAIFTHARLAGSRNVIAPDHTFWGYPNTDPNILNSYAGTHKSLVDTNVSWSNKRDECVFIGSINPENHRAINTSMNLRDGVRLVVVDQGSGNSKFVSRESLSDSKYLLHLNGHRGAYTSRLKYLLGAGSLVLYNTNSGQEQNFWQEWWMDENLFVPGVHYERANSANEIQDLIEKLHQQPEKCSVVAENGKRLFTEKLCPSSVRAAWAAILNEYAARCEFSADSKQGFEYNTADYETTDRTY